MSIQAFFTGKIDRRYAWIGNEAQGEIDILDRIISLISSATTSIEVSSMTFNYTSGATPADGKIEQIATLLAAKAESGVNVRIFGNGGHRYQDGYFRSHWGPVQLADCNLPAVLYRISFQRAVTPAPAGFLVDSGLVYGARYPGVPDFGWTTDVSDKINAHSGAGHPIPAGMTNPLLRECFAGNNGSGPKTWRIGLPEGYYYVFVATGEAAYNSKSFISIQGDPAIFLRKIGGVYSYENHTDSGSGEFGCSTVDGGADSATGLPMAKRFYVPAGGHLEIGVGKAGEPSFSSLDYIEIYRASASFSTGDKFTNKNMVQEKALHHTKFILVDAATPARQLWTGSHNLTPVDPTVADVRSEDAILTDDPDICNAFLQEFNQWWGSIAGAPDAGLSRTGVFKQPVAASGTTDGVRPGTTVPWQVRFSPSTSNLPSVNLFTTVNDFIASANRDILLMVEQITDGGNFVSPFGTYTGSSELIHSLRNQALSGAVVQGLVGNDTPSDDIFTDLQGIPTAKIGSSGRIHDKFVCSNALRDNHLLARGKVLCGSMNWSQSGLHLNNEQTLIIEDPSLTNQFLQRAAYAFKENGIAIKRSIDCVVVLDRSYSMTQASSASATKIQAAREAAKVFIDLLDTNGNHRLGLVRFGIEVEPFVPPSTLQPLTNASATSSKAAIDTIEATLPIGSATCYGLALQEAYSMLTSVASPNQRQVVVFLSDGLENHAPNADTIYPLMSTDGIEIHTTSFGLDGYTADAILSIMADTSGGSFAHVDESIDLQKRFADVARDAMDMVIIADPRWNLKAGKTFTYAFPVDMTTGELKIVLLWGGQQPPDEIRITTPWNTELSRRSRAVTCKKDKGYEVWCINLELIPVKGKYDVRGDWVVTGKAPLTVQGVYTIDLCVYATDEGSVRVVGEIENLKDGKNVVQIKVWDNDKVAENYQLHAAYLTPSSPKGIPGVRKELTILPVKSKDARLTGVFRSVATSKKAGQHTIHVVIEGKTVDKQGKISKNVKFRREKIIRWYQEDNK